MAPITSVPKEVDDTQSNTTLPSRKMSDETVLELTTKSNVINSTNATKVTETPLKSAVQKRSAIHKATGSYKDSSDSEQEESSKKQRGM